jgi:hypothetical protein
MQAAAASINVTTAPTHAQKRSHPALTRKPPACKFARKLFLIR